MPPSRNNRNKKGKKGGRGKKAVITTADTANPPPGNTPLASREIEPPNVDELVADTTSLTGGTTSWSALKEKRDRKLLAKSIKRTPSLSRTPIRVPLVKLLSDTLRINVIGPDGESIAKENASILRCKKAKTAYEIVKRYKGRWDEMKRSAGTFYVKRQWAECEREESYLLDDIDRALSDLLTSDDDNEKLILILDRHISSHFTRCDARFRLDNSQGTIDDVNAMLALLEAWKGDGDEEHRLSVHKGDNLYRRGVSHFELGNLRAAKIDLRAACAHFRLYEDRHDSNELVTERGKVYDACKEMVVEVMAEQKAQANASRPHYTRKEAGKIEKELGMGIFSEEKYRCIGCGVEPSDSVELFRCGGCESVWLCGKACQKKTWQGGHKQCCILRKFQMGHNQKRALDEGGRYSLVGFEDGFRAVFRDEETGHYFDSLSNADVTVGSDSQS